MKKVLLIALMACGLAFIPAQRSDAQVSVGIGVGYPSYGYRYYPRMDTVITHMDTIGPIGIRLLQRAHVLQREPLLPPPSESSCYYRY